MQGGNGPIKPVETFQNEDAQPSQRWYAKVNDPNGNELTRTSEGYTHAEDAVHAVLKSSQLVLAALLAGALEEFSPASQR